MSSYHNKAKRNSNYVKSPGMWNTVQDIAKRITRGGTRTDQRTKKHLKKAK